MLLFHTAAIPVFFVEFQVKTGMAFFFTELNEVI